MSLDKGKGRAVEADSMNEPMEDTLMADDTSSTEGEMEFEDYEAERKRQILENQALMAELGLGVPLVASSSSSILQIPKAPPVKRRPKSQVPIFDRSGHITSLPPPGEVYVLACVEIPSDRRIRKRISDKEYTDCSDWAIGEERRWRFGRGRGELYEGEIPVVGGVGPDFRWRKWRGMKKELKAERDKLDNLIAADVKAQPVSTEGVSAYSLIPGLSCHQCRRKSEKEKMQCRNIHPECKALFCETCCKRYSYFEFDPDARSFICPLCKGCCNCSVCLRKRNLAHLLDGRRGIRVEALMGQLGSKSKDKDGVTIQALLDEAVDTPDLPFDRIRLVDKETDIFSPELPPEIIELPPKSKKQKMSTSSKLRGRPSKGNGGGPKKKKKVKEEGGKVTNNKNLVVKLRMPQAEASLVVSNKRKEKMYDSDGDTVGGSTTDGEDGSSRLTPLDSGTPSPKMVPKRLPFPPRMVLDPTLVDQTYSDNHRDQNPSLPTPYSLDQPLATPLNATTNGNTWISRPLFSPYPPLSQNPYDPPPPVDMTPATPMSARAQTGAMSKLFDVSLAPAFPVSPQQRPTSEYSPREPIFSHPSISSNTHTSNGIDPALQHKIWYTEPLQPEPERAIAHQQHTFGINGYDPNSTINPQKYSPSSGYPPLSANSNIWPNNNNQSMQTANPPPYSHSPSRQRMTLPTSVHTSHATSPADFMPMLPEPFKRDRSPQHPQQQYGIYNPNGIVESQHIGSDIDSQSHLFGHHSRQHSQGYANGNGNPGYPQS